MNKEHKDAIAKQQIQNLCELYGGTVKYQSVYTPKGKPIERIVIEYELQEDS